MNELTLPNNNQNTATQMSSKEIAEVTSKTHSNVLRDIRAMLEELDESDLNHEQYQALTDDRGYTSEILLNKELTEVLVMGYSAKLRLAVIRRLRELEEQLANPVAALPNFTNPAEAAIAWAEQYKAKEVAQLQVVALEAVTLEQAPKVEYCDKVLDQTDLKTVSDVAGKQGLTAQELNKILKHLNVYDDRTGITTFRSAFVNQGLGKMTTSKAGYTTAKLTIEGEYWVTTKAMKSEFAVALVAAKKAKLARVKNPKY